MEGEDVRTMVMFGQGIDAKYWVEENKDKPDDITTFILFPAAQFGQVETLKTFIAYGNLKKLETDNRKHFGWNLYHFAIYGYHMNCSYLIQDAMDSTDQGEGASDHLPKTPDEARQIQLDIIYALHEGGAPITLKAEPQMGPEANILSPPPLHPSLMALDNESHFSEAAFLIDMLCVMSSDQPVPTPGLDNVEVTSNNNHRRALYHLIEWAYSREYLNILSFCHDRYLSLCSDSLRFRDSNYPIFLAAVSDKRLNVLEMVFNHQDKRPLPDRILSRPYSLVKNKDLPKASAIGVAATKCLEGRPDILNTMLAHQILGNHLVNISLSELDFTQVPIEIFHVNLKSLTLSNNQLTILPPVENWKCSKLSFLNISSNLFTELPPGIFSLAKLISLDASNNRIQHLDVSMWSSPSLKSLYLSSNQIESLPVPNLDPYQISLQMQNFTSPVGSERETWNSVRQSFIDFSSEREEDYHLMDSGHRLEFLDLSNNRLTSVPSGLPCLAPMLLTLKLNKNQIEDFKCFNDYPTLLKSLDLSNNIATQSIICKEGSPGLASFCLQSKPGQITRCVHIFHWRLANLQYLNYSFNRLRKVMVESKMGDALGLNFTQSTLTSDTNSLFPKLHSLYLNSNRLTAMPQGIHNLEHLGTLDVRDNPEITELPSKLHHLKNLIGFQYRGIGDPIIATLDTFKDTAQVLYYLRARETDAVVNKTMRLFVIGHSQKGKSTVLRTLKGEKPSKESISRARLGSVGDKKPVEKESVGIQCDMWRCVRKKSTQTIIFYTWDFVGHDEYYVTHQCFLTNRALYLLVWKLTDKEQGIEGLSVWLRNLQAGAPYAQVIIIGTHLDQFRRNERHSDVLLDKYRKKIMQDCSFHNRMSPMIKGIVFVGFSEPLFGGNITPINFDELNDKIFDTANSMEIPRSSDAPSFKMKLMDEKIPKCYLELQELVQTLVMKIPNRIIYKKTDFCALKDVKDIIDNEQEIDAAIDFLHNMGRVFHFHKPYLEDFYILSPQWWFNACALIISPNVVNSIVSAGSEPGSGLLNFKAMEQMFIKKNLTGEYAGLIFSFLHQYGVILPVDKETALVPSMISPIPSVKLFTSVGYFPRDVKNDKGDSHQQTSGFSGFFEYLPAALKSLPSKVKVVVTGLVYRRMFLLPPLPAGFWSKLIALCLQKNDFVKIIANIAEDKISSSMGGHGLYYHLESCVVRWSYWKTGLVLFINDTMLMSINSLKMDEFIDPLDRAVISASYDKVKNFHFADSNGDIIPVTPFKEIIEVVVPEVDLLTSHKYDRNISAKLLAKGLEMIDEVLKGHCETLSENGIYTIGDMLHIVPCPLCFGDVDYRSASWNHAPMNQHPSLAHRIKIMSDKKPLTIDQVHKLKASNVAIVFSIDQCIRASMTRSYIECPICKDLELEYLVPDIIFKDLSNMKLDRDLLMDMPKSDGSPIGSGCYGVVYHKQMRPLSEHESPIEVAVKEFRSTDMDYDAELEVIKSYSDMRYEINKLCTMNHNYVVKFIGLLSNPRSFVLEWAPLMSLEKIRQTHEAQFQNPDHVGEYFHLCPVSIYLVLIQVLEGLHYLHTPPNGIIHSDLKLSNILAYRFPPMNHDCCYDEQDRGRCSACLPETGSCNVLVKLGDMGVSVNPAAHSTDTLGVQRFAPECIRFNSKKTEKVDIFCLALCLYELMTLRGLPPRGISELEYKNQLKKNWRPLFHSKDPPYPLPLYLCLEQCWQQDYNMRPSALTIKMFLENVTGLYVKKQLLLPSENMYHLLECYQVTQEEVVTHVCAVPNSSPLTLCMVVGQKLEAKTLSYSVIMVEPFDDGQKMVFKTSVLQQFHEEISCLCVVSLKEMYVGMSNGSLWIFKGNEPPHQITHGDHQINFIKYLDQDNLFVIGDAAGLVHIIDGKLHDLLCISQNFTGFYSKKLAVQHVKNILAYQVIRTEETLELWCGGTDAHLEVWSYPMTPPIEWSLGKVEHTLCTTATIPLRHTKLISPMSYISKMCFCSSLSSVFLLLGQFGSKMFNPSSCICQVKDKIPLRYWECMVNNVSSFAVSSREFVFGTRNGHAYVVPMDTMFDDKSMCVVANEEWGKLTSHLGVVLDVMILEGVVHSNGFTSYFPTYLGRQRRDMGCHFLLTVGQGCLNFKKVTNTKHNLFIPSRNGTYISLWII